jgi:preprotein translocase SecE subunit
MMVVQEVVSHSHEPCDEEVRMSEEKKQSPVKRLKNYLHEVVLEMKRSTWPDRRALVTHTFVVIIGVILLGVYVGISDKILEICLRWLVPRG